MIFIWLIVWLCQGHPSFNLFSFDSAWSISLFVVGVLDLIPILKKRKS